ncbi:probable glutathione S-transferase GSTF1 [Hordeum vulgare subsp. vulgare]|uniref:glutathione transferase n=1 Tax=Hordeum vulgare subsp. vulgare TaxID=112509 RepID=A0A8I6X303_HORVV|nr:probable glutathione S-transferase GSTF1 [Hordeum vulgare subsp. vulgare]
MGGGAVKVYGVGASPFVATVLLCLEEVGADYELVPLDMAAREQRAEPHLSRNPFGKIPVLEDGELTLFESRAISLYVLRKHGWPGTKLQTADLLRESCLEESAMVDVWTEVEAHQYQPAIASIVQQCVILPFVGGARDQAVVDENVGKLEKVLDVYEARLSAHAYLAGDFFSLADLVHFGITYYLVAGTEYATLLESRANVWAWWGRVMARPSVKKVAPLIHLWLKPSLSA